MKIYYIYETFAILQDALNGPIVLFVSVQDKRTQATGDIPVHPNLKQIRTRHATLKRFETIHYLL